MTDKFSKKKRSEIMSKVGSKNTKPEIAFRKAMWRKGYRYNINQKSLPGKPDIVLPKYRTVIFVNGCFWHQHSGCKKSTVPKTNVRFWNDKLLINTLRDKKILSDLRMLGWKTFVVWECQINHNIEKTIDRIDKQILRGKTCEN